MAKSYKELMNEITTFIFDVDGVLTDGGILYDNEGMEYKKYNVKDGLIVQHLKKAGFLVGAITGRASQVVENRCEELRLDFHYHGVKDKYKKLAELLETMELTLEEVAYLGDDLIDLPVLTKVGLSIAPADACPMSVQRWIMYPHWLEVKASSVRQQTCCCMPKDNWFH